MAKQEGEADQEQPDSAKENSKASLDPKPEEMSRAVSPKHEIVER